MTFLDFLCIAIIVVFTAICAFKGMKKIIFRMVAFIVAMLVAKLLGYKIGNFLLSDIIQIDIGPVSNRVKETIISVVGTLLLFVILFIFLRLIFKVVEGKFEKNIQSIIIDRLCGALVGFLLGISIVFVFTEVVDAVLAVIAFVKKDIEVFNIAEESIIFRLFRNLN